MTLVFTVLLLATLLEAVLFAVPTIWQSRLSRRWLAVLIVPLLTGGLGGLLMFAPTIWSGLIVWLGLYRLVNILRVAEGRSSSVHLRTAVPRSELILITSQLLLVGLWYGSGFIAIESQLLWLCFALLQLLMASIILLSTLYNLRHTQPALDTKSSLYLEDAPTVTVAIPARNETRDLEAVLRSLIASTYPKLEILVLDDCSQFRRTPEIIREFAHAGVRFVQGDTPRDGWLAKNQAYNKLTREASGKLILYCGVDIRFAPDTITKLVSVLLARNKRMLCVLPERAKVERVSFSVIQAARYAWELSLPRRLLQRPPVLSSCWLIYRSDVKRYGGFGAVARSIVPEAYFAKRSITADGYSFLRSAAVFTIKSAKTLQAQRQTAVRVRYPAVHRRPEQVALITAFQLSMLLGPLAVLAGYLLGYATHLTAWLALLACLLLVVAYGAIVRVTRVVSWLLIPIGSICSVLADAALLHISMWLYEFDEVRWKGRNVCRPVMRVEKSLPKIS